ncbi:MAG: type III-A CRISPR-associated protein Csm2 [Rhizonema sp. PD37]|nr:type III-A CRISPR-associated protein Csm2 [Rhizonema sp. PD37]
MIEPNRQNKHSVQVGNQRAITSQIQTNQRQSASQNNTNQAVDIVKHIIQTIDALSGLKTYPIRDLVRHAADFGLYLKQQRLETNQIRKFLDAVNQIKAKIAQDEDKEIAQIQRTADAEKEKIKLSLGTEQEINDKLEILQQNADVEKEKLIFSKIETDVVLLKPKLAYAAARQKAAKPLGDVMSAAIDKVYSKEDFERLVQFIESIIAYHKAEGGR